MNTPCEYVLAMAMTNQVTRFLAFKLLPNHYQYKRPTIRKVVRKGIKFSLDISNWNDWEVYFNATEKSLLQFITFCEPGFVVLDVGTNIGYTALSFAVRVGPSGKVFGFEPHSGTFRKLQANSEFNSFSQLHISQVALGAKPGRAGLQVISENNSGKNRITGNKEIDPNQPIEVTTVDVFCDSKSLQRVDLMKIDVEGFELEVIKGALNTLERFSPVLFIELDDENLRALGTTPAQLVEELQKAGYKVSNARTQEKITVSSEFNNCHFDIFCRKES